MRTKLKDGDVEKIKHLRQSGMSCASIASVFSLSKQYVNILCTDYQGLSDKIRLRILMRDKFICQKCNIYRKKNLDIHHIDGNSKNNIDTNLISLCRQCHAGVHSKIIKL